MTIAVLYGLARMPVFRAAILMLFELLVAAISAWILTDERMSSVEWLGGALIFIAAYGMARLGKN
jgi:drug/metabolite transporter (DMT)-like permease